MTGVGKHPLASAQEKSGSEPGPYLHQPAQHQRSVRTQAAGDEEDHHRVAQLCLDLIWPGYIFPLKGRLLQSWY